ncbi:hypothetical protein L3Y34_011269 [Caenorhabditis briggsae]|uniref:Uncharacterized protein n=1 Tax=Caenorhabditis briggsae TaxID=6238 RepID=A0AAE8ZPR8_CAEBR|nr:hypothetical protein L3Y34_011269 [Caenorhabditis briggsae]
MSTILDPKSEIYKRTAIHCLFEIGLEPDVVVGELGTRFPGMTTEEVDSWFSRFRDENFEIGKNVSIAENGVVIDKSIDSESEVYDLEEIFNKLERDYPEFNQTTQIGRAPHVNVYKQYTAQRSDANQISLASLNLSSNLDVQSTSRPPKFPPSSIAIYCLQMT